MTRYPTLLSLRETGTLKLSGPSEQTLRAEAAWAKENLAPWYEEAGTELVPYRGVRDWIGSLATLRHVRPGRSSRAPTGMLPSVQRLFDERISEAGLIAKRRNSYFVTGDIDAAMVFGNIVVAIPVGKFNYTWSPDIADANFWRWELEGEWAQDEQPKDTDEEALRAALEQVNFRGDDGSLRAALESGHEILIKADEFVYYTPNNYNRILSFLQQETP